MVPKPCAGCSNHAGATSLSGIEFHNETSKISDFWRKDSALKYSLIHHLIVKASILP